jgi:hypothetical protein
MQMCNHLCNCRCDIGVTTKVTCAFMALTLIVQMVARGRAVAQHVAHRYVLLLYRLYDPVPSS